MGNSIFAFIGIYKNYSEKANERFLDFFKGFFSKYGTFSFRFNFSNFLEFLRDFSFRHLFKTLHDELVPIY